MYDRQDWGGNGDGLITDADADWQFLRLWLDENADGVTDPGELYHLEDWNVSAIDLRYRHSERRDQHGNLLRYRGKVYFSHPGGRPHSQMVDVFFAAAPPPEL